MAYLHHGAQYGNGVGLQGRSYALPTKSDRLKTLSRNRILTFVLEFLEFAEENPHLTFHLTRVGCGLAGYKDCQIAPLFIPLPMNVEVSTHWEEWFPKHNKWTKK